MVIKLVIFDFDGVFTDGKVNFNNNEIIKYYNIKDGKGISLLKKKNIKVGLLSNFNNKVPLKYTNKSIDTCDIDTCDIDTCDNSTYNFKQHLNFDYFYIGDQNKKNILLKWMTDMNITFDNIAYIGDDLNDIDILEKCQLSACPNDAVQECKDIVKYICYNKGGDGCVREFCEYIINKINNNNDYDILHEIKKEVNYQLNNYDISSINKLAKLIQNTKNNIYFIGVGKSGNIAHHCCDLLKSISIKSFTLNILNLLHGDIGVLKKNDIVIFFSNSGETTEVINIIPCLKQKSIILVGVFCKESKYRDMFDIIIKTPLNKELNGDINKIPTNSIMSHLLFSNILISILKKETTLLQYYTNHMSGKIGDSLKIVKDLLIYDYPIIYLNNNVKIKLIDILYNMNNYKLGCCYFVNKKQQLIGILTDKDIRELFINNIVDIDLSNVNTSFYYITNENMFVKDLDKYNTIPLLNNDNTIKGIVKMNLI